MIPIINETQFAEYAAQSTSRTEAELTSAKETLAEDVAVLGLLKKAIATTRITDQAVPETQIAERIRQLPAEHFSAVAAEVRRDIPLAAQYLSTPDAKFTEEWRRHEKLAGLRAQLTEYQAIKA
ncbi:MAG: hypothetical protein V4568_11905, partial [Pseudomonadota bacterium]